MAVGISKLNSYLIHDTDSQQIHVLQEVLIFLTLLTSLLQYMVQRMTYQSDLRRIVTIISDAKVAAWGPKMIPVDGKRKVSTHPKKL